jgi:hypothetical protein
MRFAGQLLEQMGEENTWRDLLFRPERDSAGVQALPYYPGQDTSTYQTLPYYPEQDTSTLEPLSGDWTAPSSDGLLARNQSFDLGYPKIPGKDVEGIPNANDPVMREKLRRRLLRNPDGGQELPGFLRQASAPWGQATGWG